MSDIEPIVPPPRCPNGLFNFDEECNIVTDPDEEILELYMDLASVSSPTLQAHSPTQSRSLSAFKSSSSSDSGGLGFLDPTQPVLDLVWELRPPRAQALDSLTPRNNLDENPHPHPHPPAPCPSPTPSGNVVGVTSGGGRNRRRRTTAMGTTKDEIKSISVQASIQQDLGMLKSSRGDTGSVLWRSSYHLSQHLLEQFHFPPSSSSSPPPLVDYETLSRSRILELGSGTGLLAILLGKLCAQYTASDRWENLKLIKRNLERNKVKAILDLEGNHGPSSSSSGPTSHNHGGKATKGSVNALKYAAANAKSASASLKDKDKGSKDRKQAESDRGCDKGDKEVLLEEIDWMSVSQDVQRGRSHVPAPRRRAEGKDGRADGDDEDGGVDGGDDDDDNYQRNGSGDYDLVLCVDCIFNEHLVRPLVDTLGYYCPRGGKTVVWVIVELRSSDVLRTFLDTWLEDPSGPWTIVRLSPGSMGHWGGQKPRWVGWIGWR